MTFGAGILSPFKGLSTLSGTKKIFITRSKNRLRFIENSTEIESVCKRYDIEVVDADTLPFDKQIQLFSQVSFIAGIHGAGLTNMVYAHPSCRVLEIFPPPDLGYLPFHYIMLAGMKGLSYHAMIGQPGKVAYSGGFYLVANQFEKELKDFQTQKRAFPVEINGKKHSLIEIDTLIEQKRASEQKFVGKVSRVLGKIGLVEPKTTLKQLEETKALIIVPFNNGEISVS